MYGKYLLLGSNLGDKKSNLEVACEYLSKLGRITMMSSIYVTPPWGKTDQPEFYNQVLSINTTLSAQDLLAEIMNIEKLMGRVRHEKWGERLIDIDILYYEDLIIENEDLIVPHPGIPDRKFTLIPLVELAPDFINPVTNKSNKLMLDELHDQSVITKLTVQDSN